MLSVPVIPTWEMLHPAVVHFPIALLLIAPTFVLIGILREREHGRPFLLAALLLMALGTGSMFLAASTGAAAKDAPPHTTQSEAMIDAHEELAETTEIVFSALTVTFAAILFVPRLLKWGTTRVITVLLPIAFLVLYSGGLVLLVKTAHAGGMLVHGATAVAQAPSTAGSAGRD